MPCESCSVLAIVARDMCVLLQGSYMGEGHEGQVSSHLSFGLSHFCAIPTHVDQGQLLATMWQPHPIPSLHWCLLGSCTQRSIAMQVAQDNAADLTGRLLAVKSLADVCTLLSRFGARHTAREWG